MTQHATGAPAEKPRRRGNGNARGSSYDRRARREFIVEMFGIPRKSDGKKTRIACHHCGKIMRVDTVTRTWEIDRFPICGHEGGRYTRDNIVPSCLPCNRSRCTKTCRAGYVVPRKIGESTAPTPPSVPIEIVVDAEAATEYARSHPEIYEPPTGDLALNEKERAVFRVIAGAGEPLKLADLAAKCFPENPKGNSWVRNSLRRLRRHGLARRKARGTYEVAQLPIAVTS